MCEVNERPSAVLLPSSGKFNAAFYQNEPSKYDPGKKHKASPSELQEQEMCLES